MSHTLPTAMRRELGRGLRGRGSGWRGATAIAIALSCTGWGYLVGTGQQTPAAGEWRRVMRILHLAQFYPPVVGGEERHVRNLAIELAARGHEVHVACLDVGHPPQRDAGVTVHALPNVGVKVPALYPTADRPLALPVPDPMAARALSRLVASVRPDVVHAHNWLINSYLPLTAARRLPLVYSLHDYSHICPTKRLMFKDELCSGPGLRKCFTCTSDWYGTGRGPLIQSMVRTGRPHPQPGRRRLHAGQHLRRTRQPARRAGGALAGGAELRPRLTAVDRRRTRATPRCPTATSSSSPATSATRRASRRCSRPTTASTRPPARPCSWSAARPWSSARCPPARGSSTTGRTRGSSRVSGTPAPPCCPASGRTRARPRCWRRWRSARPW